MPKDPLQQYSKLRKSLLAEKAKIESRLNQINEVLEESSTSRVSSPSKAVSTRPGRRKGRRNKISIRQSLIDLTSKKPMSKNEVITALQKQGVKFKPATVGVMLYTKRLFKNLGGKFQPVNN